MKFNTQKEYSTHVNDDVSSIFDPGSQTLFSRFKYFGGGGAGSTKEFVILYNPPKLEYWSFHGMDQFLSL